MSVQLTPKQKRTILEQYLAVVSNLEKQEKLKTSMDVVDSVNRSFQSPITKPIPTNHQFTKQAMRGSRLEYLLDASDIDKATRDKVVEVVKLLCIAGTPNIYIKNYLAQYSTLAYKLEVGHIAWIFNLYKLIANNETSFVVRPDLHQKLLNTKLNLNDFTFEHLQLNTDVYEFISDLKLPVTHSQSGVHPFSSLTVNTSFVATVADLQHHEGIWLKDGRHFVYAATIKRLTEKGIIQSEHERLRFYELTAYGEPKETLGNDANYHMTIFVPESYQGSIGEYLDTWCAIEREILPDRQLDIMHSYFTNMLNYLAKFCIYFNNDMSDKHVVNETDYQKPFRVLSKAKQRKAVKQAIKQRNIVYVNTAPIQYKHNNQTDEHSGTKAPHVRRGHIRNQAYGKNRALRKPVIIEPMYINMANDVPPPTTYKVN